MDILTFIADALEAWEFLLGAFAFVVAVGSIIALPFWWLRANRR